MPPTIRLVWSSRSAVAEQLFTIIRQFPAADLQRRQALSLLRLFASSVDRPALRSLLMDPAEEGWFRTYALRAFLKAGGILSPEEAATLFGECAANINDPERLALRMVERVRLNDLFQAVRPESFKTATEALVKLRSEDRVHLLAGYGYWSEKYPAAIRDWLFEQWASKDQFALDELSDPSDYNGRVAIENFVRPAARDRLRQKTPAGPLHAHDVEALVDVCPWLLPKAIDDLVLPLPALIQHLGADRLLSRLKSALKQPKWPAGYPPHFFGVPPWMPPHNEARLLAQWREARPALLEIACSVDDSYQWARSALLLALPDTERKTFVRWSEAALNFPAVHRSLSRVVARLADSAQENDGPLFKRCLDTQNSCILFFAINGLASIGVADEESRERIANLTGHGNPVVRARAVAMLAQMGGVPNLDRLWSVFRSESNAGARAVALHHLAKLDPEGSFDSLREVLLTDDGFCECCKYHQPVGNEAALAMARIDSDGTRTALLNGAFRARSNALQNLLEHCIEKTLENEGVPVIARGYAGRSDHWISLIEKADDPKG